MAVDAAPEGNLTVTVKALSGTEDGASGASSGESASDAEAELEKTEPGYIVLSATAPSCLRALGLLGATTPRTVNLSQLREIVVSQTLAETDATLSILKEIRAIYRANGEAVVVITPDQASDFIRRQRAVLGLRLSKYLDLRYAHSPDAEHGAVRHPGHVHHRAAPRRPLSRADLRDGIQRTHCGRRHPP